MNKKISFLLAVLLSAFVISSCHRAYYNEGGWYTDLKDAKEVAQLEGKDIFFLVSLDDMGEDNNHTVFDVIKAEDFSQIVSNDYVLLNYNLKQEEFAAAQSDESARKALEKKMAVLSEYQIQGAPVVLLLTKEGYYIGSFTFNGPTQSRDLFDKIHEAAKDASVLKESLAKVNDKSASKLDKVNAIEDIFNKTPDALKPVLVDLGRKVLTLDKKNESTFLPKYTMFTTEYDARQDVFAKKFASASKRFEKLAEKDFIDAEQKQYYYYMAAYCLANEEDGNLKKAIVLMKKSVEADPESENAQMIQQQMAMLEAMQNKEEIPEAQEELPVEGPELPPEQPAAEEVPLTEAQ